MVHIPNFEIDSVTCREEFGLTISRRIVVAQKSSETKRYSTLLAYFAILSERLKLEPVLQDNSSFYLIVLVPSTFELFSTLLSGT